MALETKIAQLKRAIAKTQTIVHSGKNGIIARHVDTIIETLSEVSKLRREVEAIKIAEHVSEDEIDKWNSAIEDVCVRVCKLYLKTLASSTIC